ncbi:MAG TPA: NADH-ubiquinone oxidoreductase-F iron-sulfur binding region domain-containing protein [Jatrophihabitans sp.]|nr:NADH-ubiquinone oxidoreductase-F iron-sulfur binding region domain-containing protein [Jatrophihabitans sp.]
MLIERPVHFIDATATTSLDAHDLSEHLRRWGPLPAAAAADRMIAQLRRAGLSGHGGAHFPVYRKWEAQLGRAAAGAVLVANAAEGEPLSAKDAALLQLRPQLVLDGLAIAADALGAHRRILWLHDSATASRAALEHALDQRRERFPAEPAPTIRLVPASYLAGESSAVARALAGGPALPSFQAVSGRLESTDGQPLIVHNVETLARIALLSRGIAHRSRLFTVAHRGLRTVTEALHGDPLGAVLAAAGHVEPCTAVLVGGYGGQWLSGAEASWLPSGQVGGAGVLLPLAPGDCGLRCTAAIVEYLAEAGAGQCGPCQFGLPALAELLAQLAEADLPLREVPRLPRMLAQLNRRGACNLPDGAVQLVTSALSVFAADVQAHLRARRCDA